MQNDQFEKPVAAAPVADGPGDDYVERMRQQILQTDAAEKAKGAEQRRFRNGRANASEIAAYRQALAVLEENNRLLAAIGKAPMKSVAVDDPRDLGDRALVAQINLLGRLINEQVDTLNCCEEEEAEAQWQAELAKETPIVRMLVERLEAVEAYIAELKAERSGRDRAIARAAPVRPKASMSNMGVALGDGLTPALSTPTAPPGTSPRRISR